MESSEKPGEVQSTSPAGGKFGTFLLFLLGLLMLGTAASLSIEALEGKGVNPAFGNGALVGGQASSATSCGDGAAERAGTAR